MGNSVSIIIPIFNAEKFLPNLFQCFDSMKFEKDDEILLIDNGSTDKSVELCKNQQKKNSNLYKYFLYDKKAGSYVARNYGVQKAKGDILVFTDSDTKPVRSWLSTIKKEIRLGRIIAGKIELEMVNGDLWEQFDTIAHLNSEENAKNNRIATANMAVYKDDFYKIGLFEERFSGGDYEWSQRAVKKGMEIFFAPEALVYHPTRKTFKEILKKEQRIAYGDGNHARIKQELYWCFLLKYILKIFKFDTNLRYIRLLKKRGITRKKLIEFNKNFMKIRIEQFKFARNGYKEENARKLNIK